MKKKRFSTPQPLLEILQKGLKKWGLSTTLEYYEVMEHWEEIVGEKIAHRSRPAKIQGKKLIVTVDHPTWLIELQLLKEQILEKIKTRHPKSDINDLRFVIK